MLELHLSAIPHDDLPALIPAVLCLNAERRAQADAARACRALTQLARALRPGDLLRRVATGGGALSTAALAAIADAAEHLHAALADERVAFAQALDDDRATRHRLDGSACGLLVAAQDLERQQRAVAAAATQDLDKLRTQLFGAGLTDDEVAAILVRRADGKASEQTRRVALVAVDDAVERGAMLGAFLADPLRDLGRLPPVLVGELEQRAKWDRQCAEGSVAHTRRYAADLAQQSMPRSKAAGEASDA